MSSAAQRQGSLLITALNATLSCAAIAAFAVCYVVRERRDPAAFPYVAEGVWLLLALAVFWLWHKDPNRLLAAVVGAAAAAMIWSVSMVDFPPWFVAHASPLVAWLIVLSPALFAGVVGATMHKGYLLAGGLMLLLGGVGQLPVAVWNVASHPEEMCSCQLAEWPYPYIAVVPSLIILAIQTSLGVGGAALGHLLRKRILR